MSWRDDVRGCQQNSQARLFGLAFEVAAKLDESEKRVRELLTENDDLRGADEVARAKEAGAELQQRIDTLEEREGFWRSYVKLLGEELDGLLGA